MRLKPRLDDPALLERGSLSRRSGLQSGASGVVRQRRTPRREGWLRPKRQPAGKLGVISIDVSRASLIILARRDGRSSRDGSVGGNAEMIVLLLSVVRKRAFVPTKASDHRRRPSRIGCRLVRLIGARPANNQRPQVSFSTWLCISCFMADHAASAQPRSSCATSQ